jgi:hypothetical protein
VFARDDLVGPTCHTHSSSPTRFHSPRDSRLRAASADPRHCRRLQRAPYPTHRALPDRPSPPPGARTVPGFPLRARLRTPQERGEAIWPRRRRAHPPPTRGTPDPTAPPPPFVPPFRFCASCGVRLALPDNEGLGFIDCVPALQVGVCCCRCCCCCGRADEDARRWGSGDGPQAHQPANPKVTIFFFST